MSTTLSENHPSNRLHPVTYSQESIILNLKHMVDWRTHTVHTGGSIIVLASQFPNESGTPVHLLHSLSKGGIKTSLLLRWNLVVVSELQLRASLILTVMPYLVLFWICMLRDGKLYLYFLASSPLGQEEEGSHLLASPDVPG